MVSLDLKVRDANMGWIFQLPRGRRGYRALGTIWSNFPRSKFSHGIGRVTGTTGQRCGHGRVQFPIGDFVGSKACQDGMPAVPSGKAEEFGQGVPDREEDAVHVRPTATAHARLARLPQQLCQLGFQLDQFVPGDAVCAFKIANVWIRMHGPVFLSLKGQNLEITGELLNRQTLEMISSSMPPP